MSRGMETKRLSFEEREPDVLFQSVLHGLVFAGGDF